MNEIIKHTKLAWVCDVCGWLQVSDSRLHHQMDFCQCKNHNGVDLEYYMCRILGKVRFIAEKKDGDKWRYKRK